MNWRVISACATLLAVLGPVPTAAACRRRRRVFRFHDPGSPSRAGWSTSARRWSPPTTPGTRSQLFVVECRERQDARRHRLPGRGGRRRGARPRGRARGLGRRHRRQPARAAKFVTRLPGRPWVRGSARSAPPAYRLVYPEAPQPRRRVALRRPAGAAVRRHEDVLRRHRLPRAARGCSRSRANRLQPVGRVREFATDAALMRDGRHLLVRGYDSAGVYTFPGLRRVGDFTLPAQRQGEGISVGPGDRIRLSSEGRALGGAAGAAARRRWPRSSALRPPRRPARRLRRRPTPSATRAVGPMPTPTPTPASSSGPFQRSWLLWSIPGVIALGAIGIGLGLRRRSD